MTEITAINKKNNDHGLDINNNKSSLIPEALAKLSSANLPKTTPSIMGARGNPNFFIKYPITPKKNITHISKTTLCNAKTPMAQ